MLKVKVSTAWVTKKYTKQRHKKGPAFVSGRAYAVQGFDHDDQGNGYVILVNEYRELWWVNNRHVRVVPEKAKK